MYMHMHMHMCMDTAPDGSPSTRFRYRIVCVGKCKVASQKRPGGYLPGSEDPVYGFTTYYGTSL